MLQKAFHTALRILCLGRPKDWPYLFYVICILKLVNANLHQSHFTDACQLAAEEMESSLYELCRLFHFSTDNVQPLNSSFDINNYASLVDDDELAVKHYQYIHQSWEDNGYGDELEEDSDDLWENIDRLVLGFID